MSRKGTIHLLITVFVICLVIAIFNQSPKELRQMEFIQEFQKAQQPKQPSQNYIVTPTKIIPKTILSEADAKRPCEDCHDK
jgi:hypothetical protein